MKQDCRKCGLPKKASYQSARKLTRFETDTCKDTPTNKSNFNFDRTLTFCNATTCDVDSPRKNYAELHRIAREDLGKNFSTAQFVKWRKGIFA